MTKMSTTEKWTISIDEELFGPPAAGCGLEVSLLVDPENHTVTTWSTVGGGCPESVYHSRALRISVSDTHHSGDLAEYLRESTGLLDEIADLYLGSEWDGSNHVGEWDGDPLGLVQKIEHDISLEVPQYHDFSDDIAHGDLTEEILRQVEEDGVENCADAFISEALGNYPPIYYDRDDVIEAIEQVVESIQSE